MKKIPKEIEFMGKRFDKKKLIVLALAAVCFIFAMCMLMCSHGSEEYQDTPAPAKSIEPAEPEEAPKEPEDTPEEPEDAPEEPEDAPEESTYAARIVIESQEDVSFYDPYDVDVLLDGEKIGSVEANGEATFDTNLTLGLHNLEFVKKDDSFPIGVTVFTVWGESNEFSYLITCTDLIIKVESTDDDAEDQADDESSEKTNPNAPKYGVQIYVDCERNVLFSTYDVDVYVDGEKIGNIDHGSDATFGVSLTKGQHDLVFIEEGMKSPKGKTTFVVEDEGDKFGFNISCTSDQIEIRTIREGEAIPDGTTHSVSIYVDCEKNLLFSKYDVDVKVDGEVIGNVEHGSEATFEVNLTEGQHVLEFVKEGKKKPVGKISFIVSGEGNEFSYLIHCTNDEIEIETK